MRKGSIKRNSKETQIQLALTIEGRGRYQVSTGIRFFDHMLELFAHHGGFDLKLKARGDLDVDQHHTVEDVGIVLGQAFDKALGSKRGILRAGYFLMPMDETMGMAAVDFCGRTAAVVDTKVRTRLVGDLQAELVDDFFEGFARGARANVHARVLYGRSNHHKIEALFKAFARALRAACWRDQRMVRLLPINQRSAVMIAIVDYGAGNLVSVKKALDWLGQECTITSDPQQVASAAKIVLPVWAILHRPSLWNGPASRMPSRMPLRGIPFLGICVGMQWMFAGSEEAPRSSRLGMCSTESVTCFPPNVKSPHVGWNQLEVDPASRLLRGVPSGAFVYFTHSFRAPMIAATVACCEYGGRFSAAVERDRSVRSAVSSRKIRRDWFEIVGKLLCALTC